MTSYVNDDTITLPHNELIVGMTGSGKTHYLICRLNGILKHNPSISKIFIICPTLEYNRAYQEWRIRDRDRKRVTLIGCPQDDVSTELREIIGRCRKGSLLGSDRDLRMVVVLDDCAHGQSVKGRTSELVELAFTARHFGMATIVLTQQLKSIAKPYRENATLLISFYNTNKRDSNALYDEYLEGAKGPERDALQTKLKTIRYSYLMLQLTYPYRHVFVSDTDKPS